MLRSSSSIRMIFPSLVIPPPPPVVSHCLSFSLQCLFCLLCLPSYFPSFDRPLILLASSAQDVLNHRIIVTPLTFEYVRLSSGLLWPFAKVPFPCFVYHKFPVSASVLDTAYLLFYVLLYSAGILAVYCKSFYCEVLCIHGILLGCCIDI